ncbi:MAG: DUF4430 domain-containing protein [Thermoleophilia bacterium]
MLRRSATLLGILAGSLALAAPALAVDVTVRVEGKTRTLFGTELPSVEPFEGTLAAIDTAGAPATVELRTPTPLGALEAASREGEFYYHVTTSSFGAYVDRVGRFAGTGASGWVFKVNGRSPSVGASAYRLRDGDDVLWYYATFGAKGGPLTLEIRLEARTGCLVAIGRDDKGVAERVRNVRFELDTGVRRSATGRVCPDVWHSVRVVKKGAVPSSTRYAG